jgi:uncharacterized protein YkwD
MQPLKKITTGLLLILIGVGFFFVYKKDKAQVVTEVPVTEQTVKGTTKTEPNTAYVFTETEGLKRLALTPANVVWYSNYYRNQVGLPPLIQRKALNQSALAKNTNMFLYRYFDHTQPGSTIGFDRFIDDQGYLFIKVGENLAMGDFTTSKEVVDAWMKSPSHKKNILDTTYTEIGVNVKTGTMQGKEVVLITQHFGKPRKSCPTIDSSIKDAIADLNVEIKQINSSISAGNGDYNTLVTTYNDSVARMGTLVEKYNAQVKAFDTCVTKGN